MKIKLSKNQWEFAGKKAGWIKEAVEDNKADSGEDKKLTFSFGTTPEDIIKDRVNKEAPSGYKMNIKNQKEWSAIAKAVNKGIDSYLEGFTRSTFDNGRCVIHPEEMTTLLRRLFENNDDESWQLRSDILYTLGIEEI